MKSEEFAKPEIFLCFFVSLTGIRVKTVTMKQRVAFYRYVNVIIIHDYYRYRHQWCIEVEHCRCRFLLSAEKSTDLFSP